jgi:heptosyltransferase II
VTAFERILVFQPAYLGDVVFASPLTAALSTAWPGAEIVFVARPPGDGVARLLPGVNRVLTFDKRGRDRGLAGLGRMIKRIRELAPDAFFSLHGSLRSGLIARFSGAAVRVGPAGFAGSFGFTQRVRWEPELTFTARARALAGAVGVAGDERLALALPEGLRESGRRQLVKPTVALIPGSVWPTKRWPAAHAGRLAAMMGERGFDVILLGSEAERDLCQEVVNAGGPTCRNLAGGTVEEALAVLSACRAAVGGDSGLSHAARALGIPVVTLFGPTSAARHEQGTRDLFVSLGLPCSPCSDHGQKRCPLGHHDCLRKLSAELVAQRLLPMLDGSGAHR